MLDTVRPAIVMGSALLASLFLVGLARNVAPGSAAGTPIYSVAAVRADLESRPAAWIGRPLQVRGLFAQCEPWLGGPGFPCADSQPQLVDATNASAGASLRLGWAQPSWPRAVIGRTPFLGPVLASLLPAPQAIQWGVTATYRVEIVALPGAHDGSPTYEALLL